MSSRARVVVVGLGPAGPDLLPPVTTAAIDAIPARFLRTSRHPAAGAVRGAGSFDHVYESAASLDDVYPTIVGALVDAAAAHGEVLYAVPGSPVVAERTVELLLDDERVDVVVLPAMSFLDLAWVRLGVDPIARGVRVIDGHRFEVEAAGQRGPLLVAQCDSPLVLGDIKLAMAEAADRCEAATPWVGTETLTVTVLSRLGAPDEQILTVPWFELDRVAPDHLTSVWIPTLAAPVAGEVQQLVELMSTLRRRCPWDAEQTHASLRTHLLEETYEVLEAIDGVDAQDATGYEHLEEELGDLLFQVVFHAALAAEAGQFTLADVARTVHDKLRGRHPHVFGDVEIANSAELADVWEAAKLGEKGRVSVFDGVPPALPALAEALKVLKKGAAIPGSPPTPELATAAATLAAVVRGKDGAGDESVSRHESVADVLLATVALARVIGVDPENALRTRTRAWREAARVAESEATGMGVQYGSDGSGEPAPGEADGGAAGGGAAPGGGNAPGGANGPE